MVIKKSKTILIIGLVIICVLFFTNVAQNSLGLLLQGNYFIPRESNIFTFEALKSADGSGEGWLYGKDWDRYYAIDLDNSDSYLSTPQEKTNNCALFDKLNYKTWCEKSYTKLHF